LQIRGIESEMISCCQNLLQNAAAYTPAGTQIEIVWRQGKVATPSDDWGKNSLSVEDCSAGGACLVVRDYGPGIHPEHLPKLSQRFYRADQDRSRSTGGFGIRCELSGKPDSIRGNNECRHTARLTRSVPGQHNANRCIWQRHRGS